MAKFGAYYSLCPLIDNKSLLGVSEDAEKGSVVVTLGKNIAIKYKLSDQKQIYSWRTKEKFTSAIVFDKILSKYVGVFNQSYIRLWSSDEDENIDSLKKYKFTNKIHTIISIEGNTFVIFQNGAVASLETALNSRKTMQSDDVISETDYIKEVLYSSINKEYYIGLVVEGAAEKSLFWSIFTNNTPGNISKIKLEQNSELVGCVFHKDNNTVCFLTLWRDGRIFTRLLDNSDESSPNNPLGELLTVLELVSSKTSLSLVSLTNNCLAVYGANTNEEGALLLIYNTQFKLVQTKQSFKLYTTGVKLWCNDSNIFLPISQNLAVVPFCLQTEQLAALVGSHVELETDADVSIVESLDLVTWDDKLKDIHGSVPDCLAEQMCELLKRGLSENLMVEPLLTDILEKQDVEKLTVCLDYFYDISEGSLGKILKFLLGCPDKLFDNSKPHSNPNYPIELQPLQRSKLLDLVLRKPFSDILILPHLRTELTINDVLLLLNYICFMMSEDGHCLPRLSSVETEAKLIVWGTVLIDANYQKLLMTKDKKICEALMKFKELVQLEVSALEDLKLVEPILTQIVKRKSFMQSSSSNLRYTVEQQTLY